MRYAAIVFSFALVSLFLFPRSVAAEVRTNINVSNNGESASSNVHVENNTGNNTVCVNGHCTTSSDGENKTHVCVNGQCTDSTGNVDVKSDDGHAQVQVHNNDTVTPTDPTATSVPTVDPSDTPAPTMTETPTPTIEDHDKDVLGAKDEKQFDEFDLLGFVTRLVVFNLLF